MNPRREIVELLNKECSTNGLYEKLKNCIILKKENDINLIDKWFDGVMNSLFYRPNSIGLLFIGAQNTGKTEFFRRLFPDKRFFSDNNQFPDIYNSLIVDMSEFDTKVIKKVHSTDCFKVAGMSADKRLASIAVTSNFELPKLSKLKSFVTFYISHIDRDLYSSINKLDLWIEIFSRFATKHRVTFPFSQSDILSYFKQ